MKKTIMTIVLFAAILGGSMVFSSFTTTKKADTTNLNVTDDGWEDYSIVTVHVFKRSSGGWIQDDDRVARASRERLQVQRRASCGVPEYRIKFHYYSDNWYPVKKSPVNEYSYCFYHPKEDFAMCFNM